MKGARHDDRRPSRIRAGAVPTDLSRLSLSRRRRVTDAVATSRDRPVAGCWPWCRSDWSCTTWWSRAEDHQLGVPHRTTSRDSGRRRRRHGSRHRRHDLITGTGRADGDSARRARRDLPERVRQAERAGAAHPHHGRRHDRRALDRDGSVHLCRLGAVTKSRTGSPALSRWPA